MARQCWANPNPPSGQFTKQDKIFVDVKVAPNASPAPTPGGAGNPAGIVPAGWIKQIGSDGEIDTMLADLRSGSLQYIALISQFVVPYYTGGWPPDPLAGQPGHTPQRPPGQG